ncbi:hypothetical protein E1281_34310 [Actinomadura sp. KC345]|uniref:hypothetical protein n=1 Tax=Actinomadura sp. KC345 TaxID=2530371 RepID=UPI001042BFF2|nr:hypothetical protein [Actinomadura sp. KC345]TDC44221.1 hypothetical protein E1281_34310 [Actinomadura sp. KC345]
MPTHTGPSLNEEFRLAQALEARRPDAVGRVYNVYGPELIEYAEELLGDRDRAVEAVRSALLALRDEGADPETFRDRLYELVDDECREPPVRLNRWLVATGIAAGAVLTTGMLALFESTDRDGTVPAAVPPPSLSTPATPSPTPTPSREEKEEKRAAAPDPEPGETPAADESGRLSVDAGACRGVRALGLPVRCSIRLTATGGAVKWSVASVRSRDARISADGGGRLAEGRSTSVPVTVRPRVLCFVDGSGSGTVSFAPGGSATVTYTCWER